jgi:hypothetical protein
VHPRTLGHENGPLDIKPELWPIHLDVHTISPAACGRAGFRHGAKPTRGSAPCLTDQARVGAAGTKPYRAMTATSAALSGGAPVLTTLATSQVLGTVSGDRAINARARAEKGLENP